MIGTAGRRDKRGRLPRGPARRAARHLRGRPANPYPHPVRRGTVSSREEEGPFTVRLYERFLDRLPVRRLAPRQDGHPLDAAATGHIRRVERILVSTAAGLAVLGFLGYYLPVYYAPHLLSLGHA